MGADGIEGDFNRWRTDEAHGDPDQAVLLLSDEILAELRTEGWPVQRGELGENLTLAGLPADALEPGVRVRLGEVVLEVSKACDPCTILFSLPYVGIERGPAFLRALAGRRGWFARVVQGGTIRPDMPVEVAGSGSDGGRRRAHDAEGLNTAVWPDRSGPPRDSGRTVLHPQPRPHSPYRSGRLATRGRWAGGSSAELLARGAAAARLPSGPWPQRWSCAGLRRDEFLSLGPLPGELPWGPEPVSTGRVDRRRAPRSAPRRSAWPKGPGTSSSSAWTG